MVNIGLSSVLFAIISALPVNSFSLNIKFCDHCGSERSSVFSLIVSWGFLSSGVCVVVFDLISGLFATHPHVFCTLNFFVFVLIKFLFLLKKMEIKQLC